VVWLSSVLTLNTLLKLLPGNSFCLSREVLLWIISCWQEGWPNKSWYFVISLYRTAVTATALSTDA